MIQVQTAGAMPATEDGPVRLVRSVLYMPASNPRAIAKARELPCDAVILDLEDAVTPDMKPAARAAAAAALHDGGFGTRAVLVRTNGLDTPWGKDDLEAVAAARPDGVVIPKVSSPQDLAAARSALGSADIPLWAMIETCRGVLGAGAIADAAAEHRLHGLIAGTNDLATEMRCRPGARREPLMPLLALIVAAGRAAGLGVLDGVFNGLDAGEAFGEECEQGVTYGFDGKTLVHPSQIGPANHAFTPSDAECARNRQIVAVFDHPDNAAKSAVRIDGRMVERLHLAEARRVLAVARMCRHLNP